MAQVQVVAERDELRSLLCGLNPGQARSRENVPLPDLIPGNEIERFLPKPNHASRDSFPRALRLGGDIHHLRAAIVRQVRQSIHLQPPIATIMRPG
jgi:hypothetical protein